MACAVLTIGFLSSCSIQEIFSDTVEFEANKGLQKAQKSKGSHPSAKQQAKAAEQLKQEGTHFTVYVIGSIGGKETRRQIGRLKVNAVEGDEVSRCKVVSGGKDIKTALDAGQGLLIISTD